MSVNLGDIAVGECWVASIPTRRIRLGCEETLPLVGRSWKVFDGA